MIIDNAIMEKPMLKEWELYFASSDGHRNRNIVVKAFADFWAKSNEKKLEIPGTCMLGGKVFGRQGFNDGDEVFTSNIVSIERLEHADRMGVPHDLMCATTISGSKYYFCSDGHNAYMALMLGDLTHLGKLCEERHYYLKPAFRSPKLI